MVWSVQVQVPQPACCFFLQPCNTTLLHGNKVWLLPFQFQGCNACLVTRLVLPCYKAGKQAYYQVVIFIWVDTSTMGLETGNVTSC